LAFWSREQDQDLDTLVSRPRPRPLKNELECTRDTRPWSRDHNTAHNIETKNHLSSTAYLLRCAA